MWCQVAASGGVVPYQAPWVGVGFSLSKENLTPGLAFAAAHPQTELTTTKVVPFALIAASMVSTSFTCLNPTAVNSLV